MGGGFGIMELAHELGNSDTHSKSLHWLNVLWFAKKMFQPEQKNRKFKWHLLFWNTFQWQQVDSTAVDTGL